MKRREERAVSPLKRMDEDPVFDEPWQAQVLAMADTLVVRGVVEPAVWSKTLGQELKEATRRGPIETTILGVAMYKPDG